MPYDSIADHQLNLVRFYSMFLQDMENGEISPVAHIKHTYEQVCSTLT
jgi:hypothetical protein